MGGEGKKKQKGDKGDWDTGGNGSSLRWISNHKRRIMYLVDISGVGDTVEPGSPGGEKGVNVVSQFSPGLFYLKNLINFTKPF